jgi:hypothetical protein
MTEGAEQFRMFTGVLFQLFYLLCMTGETGVCQIVGKGDSKGRMGVLVAIQAAFKLKMLFSGVAHAALGNDVGFVRGMPLMAVNTGHACFVFPAITFDRFWRGVMAFCAIVNA